jgi:hypothetical protein
MPTVYACDTCHQTSTSLDTWLMVSVQLLRWDPNAPNPPGGRTLDQMLPDLLFDKVECRDAWLEQAKLVVPVRQAPLRMPQ